MLKITLYIQNNIEAIKTYWLSTEVKEYHSTSC